MYLLFAIKVGYWHGRHRQEFYNRKITLLMSGYEGWKMHGTKRAGKQSLQDKVAVHNFRKSMNVKRPVGHHRNLRVLNKQDWPDG